MSAALALPPHRFDSSTGRFRSGNYRIACACGHKTAPTAFQTTANRAFAAHLAAAAVAA